VRRAHWEVAHDESVPGFERMLALADCPRQSPCAVRTGGWRMKEEFAKFRAMTFAEMRWYIWEYYKFHIVVLILMIFLVGTFVNARLNPRPAEYLYVAWDGVPVLPWQLDELAVRLAVIAPEGGRVTVSNYTMQDNPGMNTALQSRFIALMYLGEMDIYITTRAGAAQLSAHGYSRHVNPVREYLAEINPALDLYLQPRLYAAGTDNYMAISLGGSPLFAELGIDCADVYMSVFASSRRNYEIARALEVFLMGGASNEG